MTGALAFGVAVLLFAVAWARARRSGCDLTLRDPLMLVLASAAALEVMFVRLQLAEALILALGTVCAFTDRQTGYIFNGVLLSACALLTPCVIVGGNLEASVLGSGVCGGAMLFLHVATRGRGLGLGDVKFAALIGAGLALPAGVGALGAAFVVGALATVGTTLVRRVRVRSAIAFGPYLAIGSMLSVALTELR